MKQYEAVEQTLERLGGVATLAQLNQEVLKIKECEWKTKTPFASIRRIVQTDDKIYRIKSGLWALKAFQKELEQNGILVETETNKDSQEIKDVPHRPSPFIGITNLRSPSISATNTWKFPLSNSLL